MPCPSDNPASLPEHHPFWPRQHVLTSHVRQYPAATLTPARDGFAAERQPGVLPISSTPLPFHRNFTTLSRPSMPLEYFKAMVSPVVAVLSMPLKP